MAVTLLTPTEGMTGGETVLKKGDGSEMSVGFPQAGHLIVLQVCVSIAVDCCFLCASLANLIRLQV